MVADADLLSIGSTAQGDLYYNSGSAIARLGAGTSGQFLKTSGTGANPVWGDAGGGLLQTVYAVNSTAIAQGSSSYTNGNLVQANITPTSASSSVIITASGFGCFVNSNSGGVSRDNQYRIVRVKSGVSDVEVIETTDNMQQQMTERLPLTPSICVKDSPNTTATITHHFQTRGEGGGWDSYWNQESMGRSAMVLMEVSV